MGSLEHVIDTWCLSDRRRVGVLSKSVRLHFVRALKDRILFIPRVKDAVPIEEPSSPRPHWRYGLILEFDRLRILAEVRL